MLIRMIQAAMNSSSPWIIGKSPSITELTSSVPRPGSAKTVSTSTEPVRSPVSRRPAAVTTGISAFRSA